MNPDESISARYALPMLIGTALLIQLFGRYHAHDFTIGYFFYGWIILRIMIPLVLIWGLRIPFSKMGLGLPIVNRFLLLVGMLSLFGLFSIYLIIHFSPQYIGHYANAFGSFNGNRFTNFMIFTMSTLTGWEFLHRSFLLMGIVYISDRNHRAVITTSHQTAVLIVWIFEVLFHLIKPQMEAMGMLLGSPFLSYVTLKTGSIWPAFLIHLGVEIVFILSF